MLKERHKDMFYSSECHLPESCIPSDGLEEGKCSRIVGNLLFKLYAFKMGRVRAAIRKAVLKLEKGDLYSLTLRRIFCDYHNIQVGMYSGGGCFIPFSLKPFTTVGRYCSIAFSARVFNANHPQNHISSHALFYNPSLGYTDKDLLTRNHLNIGNDVWMGHNAVVLASVSTIGDGAIIGSNAVVHQDVPPYAIVVGNPARVVHYRFSKEIIEEMLKTRWWEKSMGEILPDIDKFQRPIEGNETR